MNTILTIQIILAAFLAALLIWRRSRMLPTLNHDSAFDGLLLLWRWRRTRPKVEDTHGLGMNALELRFTNADDLNLIQLSDVVIDRYWKHEQISDPEKVFIWIWQLEGEVNNGGFDQYYFNGAGDHALDAPRALDAIGALQAAAIVRKANALFGESGPSPDRFARQNQLAAIPENVEEAMDGLDQEFYRYPDNLEALLKQYVLSHRSDFLRET